MEHTFVQYLNHALSDHTPLVCQVDGKDCGKRRPFCFLNYLFEHKDFLGIVEAAWRSNVEGVALECVWHKLKCVKRGLKLLHVQHFHQVHDNVFALVKEA